MKPNSENLRQLLAAVLLIVGAASSSVPRQPQQGQPSDAPTAKPITMNWVYRVQYGLQDEWFQILKKYQFAILDRQKQLGYVNDYAVWAPGLHTSEESRWEYRVILVRASADAPLDQSESEVARQLFPDEATFKREENRRWELTANHRDVPIHVVDLNATGQ